MVQARGRAGGMGDSAVGLGGESGDSGVLVYDSYALLHHPPPRQFVDMPLHCLTELHRH